MHNSYILIFFKKKNLIINTQEVTSNHGVI